MFEDIFNETPVSEEKPRKNFDELDAEVIKKLQNHETNVDETVKSLEQWYRGEQNYFLKF